MSRLELASRGRNAFTTPVLFSYVCAGFPILNQSRPRAMRWTLSVFGSR